MAFHQVAMRKMTLTFSDADYERLRAVAVREGASPEVAAATLLERALCEEVGAAGLRALDAVAERSEPVGEDQAMDLAVSEVRQMGAERRAARRP